MEEPGRTLAIFNWAGTIPAWKDLEMTWCKGKAIVRANFERKKTESPFTSLVFLGSRDNKASATSVMVTGSCWKLKIGVSAGSGSGSGSADISKGGISLTMLDATFVKK